MKIVIVEDSEIISRRITKLLLATGDIEIAGITDNFEEAIAIVNEHRPEVIILDISVGKKSGLSIIHDMKSACPAAKIIMFTNFDFKNYKEISFEFGADYYLDKSNEFQNLPEVLEEIKKKVCFKEISIIL